VLANSALKRQQNASSQTRQFPMLTHGTTTDDDVDEETE